MTPFIRSELFDQHHWHAVFSTRYGGCSPAPFHSLNLGFDLGDTEGNVLANHTSLLEAVGLNDFPHQAKQVHGTQLLYCSGSGQMHADEADILLADTACALAVRTADCVPILLLDPTVGCFSAVHAGWRGTAQSIVQKAIAAMLKRGARVQHIIAAIGPCIGLCCFHINQDIAARLNKIRYADPHAVQQVRGQWKANLSAINVQQLRAVGVWDQHIEAQNLCSMCDAKTFFSYRRDGASTGRLLAIVAAKKL